MSNIAGPNAELAADIEAWWATDISHISPGVIEILRLPHRRPDHLPKPALSHMAAAPRYTTSARRVSPIAGRPRRVS